MVSLFFLINVCILKFSFFSENIALFKPTYQQFPYRDNYYITKELVQSSNAVDGLKFNLSIWGGQCVLSDNEKHIATWWVNLTSILSIHHVMIYYRTGNAQWGMFCIIKRYAIEINPSLIYVYFSLNIILIFLNISIVFFYVS